MAQSNAANVVNIMGLDALERSEVEELVAVHEHSRHHFVKSWNGVLNRFVEPPGIMAPGKFFHIRSMEPHVLIRGIPI